MATNTNNPTGPSSWGLTGTNATAGIQFGPSWNAHAGATRQPPHVDSSFNPIADPGTPKIDPITQGFARLMERFDSLAGRLEKLESPATHDPGPMFDPFDEADREYDDYRRRDYDGDGRNMASNLRNRWDPTHGRHGERYNTGNFRGRGGRTNRRGGADGHQFAQPCNRNNWDDDDQYGHRIPTCWDHPKQRQQFGAAGYEQARPVKVDAPNW